MIIFSFLTVLYSFMCCLIIFLVLVQKGKGNMGLGSMGGGNQMLFGSSGGQDVFQKTTWILCALLLIGSLGLSVLKGKYGIHHGSVNYKRNMPSSMPDTNDIQSQAQDLQD